MKVVGEKHMCTQLSIYRCLENSYNFFFKFSVCNQQQSTMARAFKKFLPMFDRVLVERFAAETKTKSGILIPEKSQGKVLEAKVVAVGAGGRNKDGQVTPVAVTVGDKVLLPEYGGTKVVLEEQEYFLFRDSDILGKFDS